MQDYIDFAQKNGVQLLATGPCQFCGAATTKGIHECLNIFNLDFQNIDFSSPEHHIYRFLLVDAHTLQHPEIHGRWNNHFHLSRLHLVFEYKVNWTYADSPLLSQYLNQYKLNKTNEYLSPPPVLARGKITSTDILKHRQNATACKTAIKNWANEVYQKYNQYHPIVDGIAKDFLASKYKR